MSIHIMVGSINFTNVIFNEKLKSLYDYIHANYSELVTELSDINRSKSANPEMREIFKLNRDKLDLISDKKFIMPDYFALIAGLMVNYNDMNSWGEVLKYYYEDGEDNIDTNYSLFQNDYEEHHFTGCDVVERMNIINDTSGNGIQSTCICGHIITQICFLKKYKEIKLIIGTDCVEKNIIHHSNIIDKNHPFYKKFKKIKKKIRAEKKIIKQTKEEYEKLISEFRKCMDCNKFNIPINEPSFKKTCKDCYIFKNESKRLNDRKKTHKPCEICKEYKVKIEYERMKYCWDCTKQCSGTNCKKRILAKYSLCYNCKK